MPEALPVPQIQDVDLESAPLKTAKELLEDNYALSLVKQTFFAWETWRRNNHDYRWMIHDNLYFGVVPQRVWDGTNVAKASLAHFLTFQQVENAMPTLMEGLFGQDDWFDVQPEPGGTIKEARAIAAHLRYVFNHSQTEFGTAEEEFEQAIREILIYGNGGLMVEWDAVSKRPVVKFVSIKDVYIDPGLSAPSVDAANNRALIYRTEMTVDELDSMREDDRMYIPTRAQLVYMSRNRPAPLSDFTKRNQEAARHVNYVPGATDYVPLPADNRIEVLIYYSKSRIIWVLNREWVAYNADNPYAFIPFCFAPCFTVTSRFYAQSYADVLEPAQQYIQALRNMRLDWLSLAANPPRIRRRGPPLPPSKTKWHPGLIDEVANPKDDVVIHSPGNDPTASVAEEVQFMEIDAEKTTGGNSAFQGLPRPGNVNRTKGGVDSQLGAAASRLALLGRHIERYLMVPLLYKMYRMIQLNSQPGETLPALGNDDQNFEVGAEAFHAPVKFRMNGPSKMMTQGKLQQVVPFIMQYLGNPGILQPLNSLGYTVDFSEMVKAIQDATGINKYYSLVRQLTSQEQQALAQPNAQLQMQMQMKQQDLQSRAQLQQMKSQTDLQVQQLENQGDIQVEQVKGQIQNQPNPAEQMQAIIDAQLKAKQGQQQLQQKQQEHVQKLQHQAKKHQLDLAQLHEKARANMQASQMDAITQALNTRAQMQNADALHQQKMRHTQDTHELTLGQNIVNNEQSLNHAEAINKHKINLLAASTKAKKAQASAKPKPKPATK